MRNDDLRTSTDRRMGQMIDKLDRSISIMKEHRIYLQSYESWRKTLERFWEDDGIRYKAQG